MKQAKPVPDYLAKRFHGWKATDFTKNQAWYRKLAVEGQRPRTMVISCCDSRVHVTSIFGAETGEFFIHRNIAALVPPHAPNKDFHGTSAAIEYAVRHLKVSTLLVVGHSGCGGVAACHDMAAGNAEDLKDGTSFIGRWLEILMPAVDVIEGTTREERLQSLEHQAVVLGLKNLMTFPFVAEAVERGELDIHGLWADMGNGGLMTYDGEDNVFREV